MQRIQDHPMLFVVGAMITVGSVTASVMSYFHSERIEAIKYDHRKEVDSLEKKYIEKYADVKDSISESCLAEEVSDSTNYMREGSLSGLNGEAEKIDEERKMDRLHIKSINASSFYSGSFDERKLFDGDSKTYWSTKADMISDASLEVVLEEESEINTVKIYAPSNGANYSQPKLVSMVFLGAGGTFLRTEEFRLKGASSIWHAKNNESVKNVVFIVIEIETLSNDRGTYLTVNELEVYGAQSI